MAVEVLKDYWRELVRDSQNVNWPAAGVVLGIALIIYIVIWIAADQEDRMV
jgi:hypothetical protein